MTEPQQPKEQPEKRKAPAFQFYVDDFLAGTLELSQADVGAYIRLLCFQWNRGSIPVETEKQQRLAGGSVSVDVLAKFRLQPDGRLVNERMEKEREKQIAYRELQAKKGIASGKARRKEPGTNSGSTTVQPSHEPDTQPKGNSPSPSPSPIIEPTPTPSEPSIPPEPPSPWIVDFGLELPESLRTNNCLDAIRTWLAYKRERKQGYKPQGLKGALTAFSKQFTPATFPSAVERSIANNWSGLFPENPKPNGKPAPTPIDAGMSDAEKTRLYRAGLL